MRAFIKTGGVVFAAIGLVVSASADVHIGGAKSAGMGGAGLALPIDPLLFGRRNPALFAHGAKRIQFASPTLGYHADGINLNELRDFLESEGFDENQLGEFARRFGDERKEFGALADLSIGFGGFNLSVSGESLVSTVPNAQLRQDIANGGAVISAASALDGYGYAFGSIDLSYGAFLPTPNVGVAETNIAVGARLRFIRGFYSHHIASGAQIQNNGGSTAAVEMAGADFIRKNGIGVDAGVQVTTGLNRDVFFAATIDNLIEPRIGFNGTLPRDNTGGVIGEAVINPFRRQFNLGAGTIVRGSTAFAADWVDVGNKANGQELRFGVDHAINKMFSVRAGYGSRRGFSVGLGVFGFNIAVGGDLPMTISTAFRF